MGDIENSTSTERTCIDSSEISKPLSSSQNSESCEVSNIHLPNLVNELDDKENHKYVNSTLETLELENENSCSTNLENNCESISSTSISVDESVLVGVNENTESIDMAPFSQETTEMLESHIKGEHKNIEHKDVYLSLLNECKLSSSSDSLYSDTPIENALFVDKGICDNTKNGQCSNLNPTGEVSEDESESISEQDSEADSEGAINSLYPSDSTVIQRKDKYKTRRSGAEIDYYEASRKFTENSNKKLILELSDLKNKLHVQENDHKRQIIALKSDYDAKLIKLSQGCESLRKEKDMMVIRYATSEKEVILAKKIQSELEKKLKEAHRDKETLANKLKICFSEKQRLVTTLEQKNTEVTNLQRDQEKLREDISCKDIKIKWVQNKLKTEMDSHKETQAKLEHNIQRLQEKREEAEQVRRDCQEMIKHYQEAEEIKSVKLDHQLKQKLSELEVQKQERSDQEEVYNLVRQELEALKKKQRLTIEENNNLTVKIHALEKERLEYEQTVCKLKDNLNSLKQEQVDLTARLAEMHNLGLQLEREKEKVAVSAREVERLRQTNAELQADMDACHMKEGELLEFTERLTAKTVHLQSEHSLLESKAQALEDEVTQLNKQNNEMEQKIMDVVAALEDEEKRRQEETQLLARKLAEKTKAVEQLSVKLEESDNENKVMKRRHITSIKELSHELYQCRKKLEIFETNAHTDATSLGSRASSSASLDAVNSTPPSGVPATSVAQVSPQVVFSGSKSSNNSQNLPFIPQEVDKNMLIERIVKLQKVLAKKNDKIEFLEDHNMQLVKEVKKKSRIIQSYVIKEETGALVSSRSDQNKLDLSKRGGIMASVYSSHLSDSNMTLELSLEINQKLQAVLEDTLLKNITLKENINTLGEEIARLTAEVSRLLIKSKNVK